MLVQVCNDDCYSWVSDYDFDNSDCSFKDWSYHDIILLGYKSKCNLLDLVAYFFYTEAIEF